MTGALVVPIGRYLGLLPVDRPAGPALEHTVRLGGRRVELSDGEHLVWAMAHGVPAATDLGRWDRTALRRHLPDDVMLNAVLQRLVTAGLVMEVGGPAAGFARAVRLLPQALGLGNDAGDGTTFRIGFPGEVLAVVPAEVFRLWSFAGAEPDLYTACERAATVTDSPDAFARAVLGSLHILLSANVACLDTALPQPAGAPA